MQEIIDQLSQPTWWFSVVFAGIIINITSVSIKVLIESKLSYWSRSIAEKNKNKKIERLKRIENLSSSDSDLFIALINLNHMKLECIFEFVLAIVLTVFGVAIKDAYPILHTVTVLMAMLSAYSGLRSTIRHGIESWLVTEVKLKRSKNSKQSN